MPGVKLILLAVLALILAGCGGAGDLPVVHASRPYRLLVTAADGIPIDSAAVVLRETAAGVDIYAVAASAQGFYLHYDAAALHAASVERGEYYPADDLFLAVMDVPGLVAIGGYHLGVQPSLPAEGLLVARVSFAAGAADRSISIVPEDDDCAPQEYLITDNGDGSVTFSWAYGNPGDYNQDGEVNIADITPIGVHFNAKAGDSDWPAASLADGDGNNRVIASDLTPIGMNFKTRITGFKIENSFDLAGSYSEVVQVQVAEGVKTPQLRFSHTPASIIQNNYYRVRAFSSEEPTLGAATDPRRIALLPPGANPVAVAQASAATGTAPLTVQFSDGGSTDSDGVIEEWRWDFDNDMWGETDATGTLGTVSHTYTKPGLYYARLIVMDDSGRSGIDTVTINIGGSSSGTMAPEAYAYCMPNQGWAPLTVYFSAFGSTDDGSIAQYEWDMDGDGSYETATADGYAQYTYGTAGTYQAALRLTDDEANTATASTVVSVRDPAESTVDYWTIFEDSAVRKVLIDIDQADWDAMWVLPEDKVEVECQANVFGEQFSQVAISMRGHRSLWDVPRKKPWQLDFNDIDDTQEYHNLKQLLFNNFFQDPSMTREKLAYDMLAFSGASASHVCYVDFWIDVHGDGLPAEFFGVYSMVERVDKKFIENRYGVDNDGGNLYKASAWMEGGANLEYLGPDITDYPLPHGDDYCYGKRTNEEEADYSDVINLCYVISGVEYDSPEQFAAALEKVFNVDSFLRCLACAISCANLDIYIYTGNNYYLYNNPATGRFEWIPWDVNDSWGLFMDPEMNKTQPLYDLGGMPLSQRVMEVERYRRDYAAYIDLLRRNWFTYSGVRTQAQGWHDLLAPKVAQDTGDLMFYGETAMFPPAAFATNWDTDWAPEPGMGVLGVSSLTQIRCDYIDAHLLPDL